MIISKDNRQSISLVVKDLMTSDKFAWDTETTEDIFIKAQLRGISFYFPNGNNYYVATETDDTLLSTLAPYFESSTGLKIGHELKYDIHILANKGIQVNGKIFDTKVAFWAYDGSERDLGLKQLTPKYLGFQMKEYKEVDNQNLEEFGAYAKDDAKYTYKLYEYIFPKLQEENLVKYYEQIEMPFLRTLLKMERKGIRLDIPRLQELKQQYETEMGNCKGRFLLAMFKTLEPQKITVPAIENGLPVERTVDFNFDSNHQLGHLLFKVRDYRVINKTESGKPSVDEGTLSTLVSEGRRELNPLLEYKKYKKLLTTYIDPFLTEHNVNGRIYPWYKQTGTMNGRLSGKQPNPQNIPIKDPRGQEVRKCFIPDDNCVFVDADYGQLELRVAAYWTKDWRLIKAFKDGVDVIDRVCEEVLGIKKEQQTKEIRTVTKAVVYGTLYGAGPRKLSIEAGIDYQEAKEFLMKYFKVYREMKKYQLIYPVNVRKNNGVSKTILGRRRYFPISQETEVMTGFNFYSLLKPKLTKAVPPEVLKELEGKVHAFEREALSHKIQGTASDLMKLAMLYADREGLDVRIQVHDQIVVNCTKDCTDMYKSKVRQVMEKCYPKFDIPLVANIKVKTCWEE